MFPAKRLEVYSKNTFKWSVSKMEKTSYVKVQDLNSSMKTGNILHGFAYMYF